MHLFCSGAPPRNGCSAPVLVAVVGVVGVFWASVVFCLGHFVVPLWRLVLWFLRNVARNSPTCISNIEITPLEFCGFLDTYEKLGYPNYVRLLVDEAPKANSCVRTSAHDTAHDPRDTSNTTPTPPQCEEPLIGARQCRRRSHFANTGGTDESERPFVHRRTRATGRHGSLIEARRVGNVHVVSIDREAPPEDKVARRPIRVG